MIFNNCFYIIEMWLYVRAGQRKDGHILAELFVFHIYLHILFYFLAIYFLLLAIKGSPISHVVLHKV